MQETAGGREGSVWCPREVNGSPTLKSIAVAVALALLLVFGVLAGATVAVSIAQPGPHSHRSQAVHVSPTSTPINECAASTLPSCGPTCNPRDQYC